MLKYVPNGLSVFRLVAVPCILGCLMASPPRVQGAGVLFILAMLSDFFDGFLARRWQVESPLGARLDPLADKALILGMFLFFTRSQAIPLWVTVLVIGRDVGIVGGVMLLKRCKKNLSIQPVAISKLNTVFQMLWLAYLVIEGGWISSPPQNPRGIVFYGLLILTTATTIMSGFVYLYEGWRLCKAAPYF